MDCGLRGGREDLIKDWWHGGREGLQEEKRLNLPKMMCPNRREHEQWGGTDPKQGEEEGGPTEAPRPSIYADPALEGILESPGQTDTQD